MTRILFLLLFVLCGGLLVQAQADLELSFSAADRNPDVYTTFIVELKVENAGDAIVEVADIHYVVPSTITAVGQGEGFATQGTFLPQLQIWEVGQLAAGESATLYLNFFNLSGTAKRVYAEVSAQSPADLDSSPGNGTPPIVVEDDEAVIVINDDNVPFCDLDLRIVTSSCDDQQTTDPTDDTYGVRIELITASTGSATVTVGGSTSTLLLGGTIELADLLISDGVLSVASELVGQATCQLQRVVQPPSACSNVSPGVCTNNLLRNGGFEDSQFYPQGWQSSTGIDYELVTDAYEGSQALSIGGATFSEIYQTIEGVPGETYNLSLKVSKTLYTIQASVQIKFLSSNWQVLGRELQSLNSIPYSTHYQSVNLSAIAPLNTKYVEVRFERYDGDGDIRLDAFCLTGAAVDPCANDNVPPTIEFCPQDIVVLVSSGTTSAITYWAPPISRDNCTDTDDILFTSTHQPGDVFNLGNTTVGYTVRDDAGNTNSCTFTVRVLEQSGGISDLSITRVAPVFSVRPGFARSLGFTLSNAGDVSIPIGVLATAYLSLDPILSTNDIPVGQMQLGGISLGRTDLRFDYTVPSGTAYGDYFIILKVDDTEVLAESDELNNVRAVPAEVRASCYGESAFPWHEWISLVAFDTYEQPSGKSKFTSYSSQPYAFSAGQEVSYTLETTFSYVTSTPHYSVYIDMDQDGLLNPSELWFEVAGTMPLSAAGVISTTSGTATLPVDLAGGLHMVRVIMNRNEFVEYPCGGVDFGEVEEYAFDISSPGAMPLVRRLKQSNGMLTASPNPVIYDYVKLRAPKLADQPVELRIVDGLGRVLYSVRRDHVAQESMEIDLPELPQGLYHCVLIPERGQLLSVGILVK